MKCLERCWRDEKGEGDDERKTERSRGGRSDSGRGVIGSELASSAQLKHGGLIFGGETTGGDGSTACIEASAQGGMKLAGVCVKT